MAPVPAAVFSSSVNTASLLTDSRERSPSSCVVITCESAAVSVGQWVTSLQTACGKLRLSNVRTETSTMCLLISSQQLEYAVG